MATNQFVDGVVDRLVDSLARGEFHPDRLPDASSAGSVGEGGGGSRPVMRGLGDVTYDYEAVPRAIDVDAFRRALTSVLTEHVGAAGGAAKRIGGGEVARRLLDAAPAERQAMIEKITKTVPEPELSKMLAEEPTPVVRSRLAGMLSRSGF